MTLLHGGINFIQGGDSANQHPLQNIAERAPDPDEVIRGNNDKLSREMRMCMPAQVISFDAEKQTVTVQPLIREKIINRQNGQTGFVALPQLVDVPVCFPQGGNFVLTMPITAGDEVLLVFSDTNIDSWHASGGIQNWNDRRRHDLSDAIAVVGINSLPNTIPDISSVGTELRTKVGLMKISVEEAMIRLVAGEYEIDITPAGIVVNGSMGAGLSLDGLGNVFITGTLHINGALYTAHQHTGVQNGPSATGGVL